MAIQKATLARGAGAPPTLPHAGQILIQTVRNTGGVEIGLELGTDPQYVIANTNVDPIHLNYLVEVGEVVTFTTGTVNGAILVVTYDDDPNGEAPQQVAISAFEGGAVTELTTAFTNATPAVTVSSGSVAVTGTSNVNIVQVDSTALVGGELPVDVDLNNITIDGSTPITVQTNADSPLHTFI